MGRYIVKRLLYMIAVFLLLTFLLYSLYQLMPGNRAFTDAKTDAAAYKGQLPPDELENKFQELYLKYQRQYGTDTKNLVTLYLRWWGIAPFYDGKCNGIFQGNFGFSYEYNQPVTEMIWPFMRNSMIIGAITQVAVLAVTIPLGIRCAYKKGSRFDRGAQFVSLIGFSTPSFITYIVFIVFFCSILKWFPVSGMKTAGTNFTGWEAIWDTIKHVTLPVICLVFSSLASVTRVARASMIDALSLDCVRTARAKGLSEKVVVYSHAWRNALIPMVAIIVGGFFGIVSGAMILEQFFGFKGLGLLFLNAVRQSDYDLVMFLQVIYTFLGLFSNLVIDLCYGLVDPRVRISK